MGVPRLFPWFTRTFPRSVKYFQQGEFSTKVDNLYLDANPILHSATQEVFNYGGKRSMINRYEGMTFTEKLHQVFILFFKRIREFTDIIVPVKRLYIAIDGPAPLAKQAQQSQRRQLSALHRAGHEFDSNSITPGTTFMLELTKYIHTAIRREMNLLKTTHNLRCNWSKLDVIFSPPTVPGEGEHKIMDYIRTLPIDQQQRESHCIFGPDGDLIMLTLAAHCPNMFLFREDIYNYGYCHLLDMKVARDDLPQILNSRKSKDFTIDDFIMIGFFVGNDFLPKIQMFYLLENGLEKMIQVYSTMKPELFLSKDNRLNIDDLLRFIRGFEKDESYYIGKQALITPEDPRFINETLLRFVKIDNQRVDLDFQGYREAYYQKIGIDTKDVGVRSVRQMVLDYVKTLNWVLIYYIQGLPSWRWFYPWHYPPLLYDVVQVLSTITPVERKFIHHFEIQEPSLPFVQLLSVLPYTSKDLLPAVYHPLMTSPDSELVKNGYYPDPKTIQIDFEGKTKEHEGVTLLPFVDYNLVFSEYKKIKTDGVYTRNTFGNVELFRYDKTYTAKYTSDYGDIIPLKVRKTIL